jgi:predicted nucleotidyltransferase
MISITETQRTIIQQVLTTISNCEVLAFGSRLSNSHADHSDLDLALVGQHRFSLLQLYELREKFSESVLPFRVDIVDWNAVSPDFQKVIASRCERLQ